MRVATGTLAAALLSAAACNPSPPPAPLSEECRAEIRNEAAIALLVTAYGRDKIELGRVEPGDRVVLSELCRVERVPVRGVVVPGASEGASQPQGPFWSVAVLWPGRTVRVELGG